MLINNCELETGPVEMMPGIGPGQQQQRNRRGADQAESVRFQQAEKSREAEDESDQTEHRHDRAKQPQIDAQPLGRELDDARLQRRTKGPERLARHHDREGGRHRHGAAVPGEDGQGAGEQGGGSNGNCLGNTLERHDFGPEQARMTTTLRSMELRGERELVTGPHLSRCDHA